MATKLRRHYSIIVACILIVLPIAARGQVEYEQAPIDYLTAPVHDRVAQLMERLASGTAKLEYTTEHGYLPSVLRELEVPVSSQVLVFSKTSLQRDRISPRTPRALYFNDDVYVGWVPYGEVVELSSVDRQQGAIFYAAVQKPDLAAPIARHNDRCLQCHSSAMTRGVPGHLVRSVYPDTNGQPIFQAGTFRTDISSPLRERWGGWYVSGTHGQQRHMGNVMAADEEQAESLDTEAGANVIDLNPLFNTARYLAPHSDIVALMVLEHQASMHNCLTAANFEGRMAAHQCDVMNQALGRPDDHISESTERRFDRAARKVVESLLFSGEVVLTEPIAGTSRFAEEFAERGPFDSQRRSLRQFDLQRRMFRYPCSYLVYSEAFDHLPESILQRVYQQLWNILRGEDTDPAFAHLSAEDRTAMLAILQETKENLPAYWHRP